VFSYSVGVRSGQGRPFSASVVALALAGAVAVAAAAEAHSNRAATSVSSAVVRQDPAAVRAYWTPARMRAAKPAARLLAGSVASGAGAATERAGVPRRVGSPTRAATTTGSESSFPNRTHGKVFFTLPGQGNFVCSGTVVTSRGRSLATTAGHCVYDNGFATNWMIVPGYRDGQEPFGEWPAQRLAAPSGWVPDEYLSYDVGIATLRRNGNGEGIEDVVGARGIAFNLSSNQTFKAFGYPAEPAYYQLGFDGERLWSCNSGRTGEDNPLGSGPNTIEIACDMTGGASGGGWVIQSEFVNSVSSYHYCLNPATPVTCSDPEHLYGPYFGAAIESLYESERGRTRRCAGVAVTNLGTTGGDDFAGGGADESMRLRSGADRAAGGGGADRLCGGRGPDHLSGGPGFDVCKGGPGPDTSRGCEVRRSIP
jgi:V8-like Glu-specific endopeptidase